MPPSSANKKPLSENQGLLPSVRTCAGSGVWLCRTLVAAMVASVVLPVEASDAGWLSDIFDGSPKKSKARAHVASHKPAASAKMDGSPKPHAKLAVPLSPKPVACDPAKFRIVVDVGHTAESEGASSARNVAEFDFNLRLARRVEEKLKAEGYAEAKLLVTAGKARPSLAKRVAAANKLQANLFLSIHHDSVPDKLLENWEFEGKKSHFSDRFSGYSVFVSHDNPDFRTSLAFAELLAKEMKALGLEYPHQYPEAIMGRY